MRQIRLLLIAALVASLFLAVAPVGAAQANETQKNVTFLNYDRNGNHIATTFTDETFDGPWATGTWVTTVAGNGGTAEGTLTAYHFTNGLVAQTTQTSPVTGRGTVFFYGGFGTLTYRMSTGQFGAVAFTATSPKLDVWVVRLLGPAPPLLFAEP
jgi:hypothetical protein